MDLSGLVLSKKTKEQGNWTTKDFAGSSRDSIEQISSCKVLHHAGDDFSRPVFVLYLLSDHPLGLETQRGFQEIQELATIGCPDGDALYDTLVTQTEWG